MTKQSDAESSTQPAIPEQSNGLPGWDDYWASLDKDSQDRLTAQALSEGYWEVYHDDDCDGVITPYPENLCLKCGMHPDFQSRGARPTEKNSGRGICWPTGFPTKPQAEIRMADLIATGMEASTIHVVEVGKEG